MNGAKSWMLLVFFLCTCFGCISQKIVVKVFMEQKVTGNSGDTVYYDFGRKLGWRDFMGTPPAGVPWGAMTASGFSFDASMDNDGQQIDISVGIYSFFTKHDSWKKPDIHSAYHLEHEQHHFDITRLGAARLKAEIEKAHFTKNNYRKVLNSVFDKVYEENRALQHQYDVETRNSMDTPKQIEWNRKISAQIAALRAGDGTEQTTDR